jgi:uncharacterized protein YceH (UPF0502 family)
VNRANAQVAGALGLGQAELRVLGCLLEKQRTTPDVYPLTLNSLRSACNQATNRDPVVEYDDTVLRLALHRLERRGLIRLASGRGSRAPKYRHLLAEALPMSPDEEAVMCVLMLRGPQTPGELKGRAGRMHAFSGLEPVQQTLARLIERRLVARLERRPGQKEERYAQLLAGAESSSDAPAHAAAAPAQAADASARGADAPHASAPAPGAPPAEQDSAAIPGTAAPAEETASLAELQERVAMLEREVAELRATVGGTGDERDRTVLPR